MKPIIHYTGQRGGPFGWGVFGQNIHEELSKLFPMSEVDPDVVIQPCRDNSLAPTSEKRGRINIGVSFFESPLTSDAVKNAANFDTIFFGSTWCVDRAREAGITNGKLLIQGVDHSIFKPLPKMVGLPDTDTGAPAVKWATEGPRQFRIFSGGKFEWRKGQDLVIRAFAEFAKTHPDAHLVCSWFNQWTQLIGDCVNRSGLNCPHFYVDQGDVPRFQEIAFAHLLESNGIPRDRFTILPQLSQADLAREMQQTDVGLFPNRCEGGTNLVLMEYSACGGKVIANARTGHQDIACAIDFAIRARDDAQCWAEQDVRDIVAAMECAYAARAQPKTHYSTEAGWTWENAAKTVAEEIERIAGKE